MAHLKIINVVEEDGSPVLIKSGFGTLSYLVNDDGTESPIPGVRSIDINISCDKVVTATLEFVQVELPENIHSRLRAIIVDPTWLDFQYRLPPFWCRTYEVRVRDESKKFHYVTKARWFFWRWSKSAPKNIQHWRK